MEIAANLEIGCESGSRSLLSGSRPEEEVREGHFWHPAESVLVTLIDQLAAPIPAITPKTCLVEQTFPFEPVRLPAIEIPCQRFDLACSEDCRAILKWSRVLWRSAHPRQMVGPSHGPRIDKRPISGRAVDILSTGVRTRLL
jgi:hypothetical protein